MLKNSHLLAVYVAIVLTTGCETHSAVQMNNNAFSNNLNNCIAPLMTGEQKRIIIDIHEVTPFKWDSMYYFSGETNEQQISYAIGFIWNGPDLSDDNRRLLFVHEKTVVSYVDFSKKSLNESKSSYLPAHFYCCSEANSRHIEFCLKSSAKFIVYKNKSEYGTDYEFLNTLCKNSNN